MSDAIMPLRCPCGSKETGDLLTPNRMRVFFCRPCGRALAMEAAPPAAPAEIAAKRHLRATAQQLRTRLAEIEALLTT